MKKYLTISLITTLIIPSIAFASWWNPFSWFTKTVAPKASQTTPTKLGDLPPPPSNQTGMTLQQLKDKQKNLVSKKTKTLKPVSKKITAGSGEGCTDGSFKYIGMETCLTPLAYCQSVVGANATYNSENNTCVTPETTGSKICSNSHPHTTWDGTYTADGKYNCVCETGYTLDSVNNSCYIARQQNSSANGFSGLDSADSQFMAEANEYTKKLNDMKAKLEAEYTAAGGFWTASQLEYNAMQKLKEEGINPPVAPTRLPTAYCNDYTPSYSQNRSGTCSGHGGVFSWYP